MFAVTLHRLLTGLTPERDILLKPPNNIIGLKATSCFFFFGSSATFLYWLITDQVICNKWDSKDVLKNNNKKIIFHHWQLQITDSSVFGQKTMLLLTWLFYYVMLFYVIISLKP